MNNFYNDRKHCSHCDEYVTYLMSVDQSFCTQCGGEVQLLSQEDWENFNANLQSRRSKGGRPRKNKGAAKKSA